MWLTWLILGGDFVYINSWVVACEGVYTFTYDYSKQYFVCQLLLCCIAVACFIVFATLKFPLLVVVYIYTIGQVLQWAWN